jgi:hypothetical protein
MAKKPTKTQMINNYIRDNRSEIEKKLYKSRYEKYNEEYQFEKKLNEIIPCNNCLTLPICVDRYKTGIKGYSISTNCQMLKTFNDAVRYVINFQTTYKESGDYERRIFKYVKKKVREGKIKL